MSATIDVMVEDAANALLGDLSDQASVEAAEAGTFPRKVWDAVEEAGFASALDEGAEGLGAAAAIARATGTHPAAVPLVETILARYLAHMGGLKLPEGPATVAPPRWSEIRITRQGGKARLTGSLAGVPFAGWCRTVAIPASGDVALVPASSVQWQGGSSYAGEPQASAGVDIELAGDAISRCAVDVDELGALLRAVQMTGALRQALAMTVQYANDRVQFGRALGKFQAIQHMCAVMAENVAAADTAAAMALRAWGTPNQRLMVGVAKIRCGEAAGIVAASAHQVHGAIGFTREHRLHHVTRRLYAWRDEFGHEGDWAIEIGRSALARGSDGLWPFLTEISGL